MTFDVLDEALQQAKSGNEQPIRSLFSFLREALARAEGQRDAYLAGWNKAAAGPKVKPPSEPKPSSKPSSPKPQASQKVIETEEDLGL